MLGEDTMRAKKVRINVVRVDSSDDNIRYILQDYQISKGLKNNSPLEISEIKKITKKDAAKPLLIEHI
jgi:hypothetical protein